MANLRPRRLPLPPLATDTAYVAAEFEYFEYSGALLPGSKPTLRLHLKNGTIIDLPTTDDELQRLRNVLNAAFPARL